MHIRICVSAYKTLSVQRTGSHKQQRRAEASVARLVRFEGMPGIVLMVVLGALQAAAALRHSGAGRTKAHDDLADDGCKFVFFR